MHGQNMHGHTSISMFAAKGPATLTNYSNLTWPQPQNLVLRLVVNPKGLGDDAEEVRGL